LKESIHQLIHTQSIICDFLTEGATETEICDTQNLEILLRMLRKENRPDFQALDITYLPLFLADWQGLIHDASSSENLEDVLEQLMGYPCKAELWESDIFTARLSPYYPDWLDSLVNNSELTWFGYDKKSLAFCFESDLELFLNAKESEEINRIFGIFHFLVNTLPSPSSPLEGG